MFLWERKYRLPKNVLQIIVCNSPFSARCSFEKKQQQQQHLFLRKCIYPFMDAKVWLKNFKISCRILARYLRTWFLLKLNPKLVNFPSLHGWQDKILIHFLLEWSPLRRKTTWMDYTPKMMFISCLWARQLLSICILRYAAYSN